MSDTIIVTGAMELDPANHDTAAEAMLATMAPTHAEDGCVHYAFSADLQQRGKFYVIEQWASQAALDAHMASAHLADFMGKMGGFGITAVSLTKWDNGEPSKMM